MECFDSKYRQPSLATPSVRFSTKLGTPATTTSDLPVLTELVGHLVNLTSVNRNAPVPVTPSKPALPDPQSSPIPHNTDIPSFLEYAEQKLGVSSTQSYESMMLLYRLPDILLHVPDDKLEEIGVARGDIIRMKKGSVKWYHGGTRGFGMRDKIQMAGIKPGMLHLQSPPTLIIPTSLTVSVVSWCRYPQASLPEWNRERRNSLRTID